MDIDLHVSRKTDFILALGAVLLLWGPGLTLPWGDRPVVTGKAQASFLVPAAPSNPCDDDHFTLPAADGPSYRDFAAFQVTVTGYSSSVRETDDSPGLTATNSTARAGVIALSQDLLREFTPGAPFSFHDRVEIPGLGQFRVEDTMHPRWTHRADVWFASREEALTWGRRSRRMYRLPEDLAATLPMPGRGEVAAAFGKANFQ